MKDGTGWRLALGALTGLGLGAVGVLVMPPLVVPGGEAIEARAAAVVPVAEPPAVQENVAQDAVAGPSGIKPDFPPEPPPDPRPASDPDSRPLGPGFDAVRVAPDGTGLVAGRAEPGATVSILADDEAVAEVAADDEGRFVAFLSLPATAAPRALSLLDGAGRVSEETVILAPTQQPAPEAGGDGAGPAVAANTADSTDDAPRPLPSEPAVAASGPAPPGEVLGRSAVPGNALTGPAGAAEPVERATADPPQDRTAAASEIARTAEGPAASHASDEAMASIGDPPRSAVPSGPEQPAGPAAPAAAMAAPPGLEADAAASGQTAAVPGSETGPGYAAAESPSAALLPDAAPEAALPPAVAETAPSLDAPEPSEALGQAAVLLSDADGVRVLQPALPTGAGADVLATVALDAIAYDGAGEVVLSGRGNGGTVRLYLDNRPAGEAEIGEDGQWTATLPDAASGVYTLRLDQLDAAGGVVSRIETPFRREERASLQAAMGEAQAAGQSVAVRVVQPGNTLWAIARDRYGEPLMYVSVFEANRDRIRDPDLIYPGQVFVLPETEPESEDR